MAKSSQFGVLCFVGLLLSSCARGSTLESSSAVLENNTTLDSGDVFDVRVYGEDDLTAKYKVSPDGTVDFPFVGRIDVRDREPTEVADIIASGLQEGGILVNPQVSVVVEEYNSKVISVMGAVASTGSFPMRTGLTIAQAISMAGGFSPLASANSTVVTRRVGNDLRRYRVRAADIIEGAEADFPLRAGDLIFVPERLF